MAAQGHWLSEASPARPPRSLFVIFGATGDLTARKIAPALYNLIRGGLIDRGTIV
ncbi:MAG: hypothetical protein MUP47_02115, partial [Phycisphaerae bacterium]|nr:hypothetical protein [Phycisphaerae bacterium]